MNFVCLVGRSELDITIAAGLSSNIMVARSCSIPISFSIDLTYKLFFPAIHAAINSASAEPRAMTSWNRVLYNTQPPVRKATRPVTEFL